MKAAEQKSAATSAAKNNTPFFNKGGSNALSSETEQPFFAKSPEPAVQARFESETTPAYDTVTPSVNPAPITIQAKCDQCDKEEDQLQKKDSGEGMIIQEKLNIGQPDDPYEKEADDMADKVLQKQEVTNETEKEEQDIPVQTKLNIGEPGDIYEKEADAVADQVVQKLAEPGHVEATENKTGSVQLKCNTCDSFKSTEKEEGVQKEEDEQQQAVPEIRRMAIEDAPPVTPPADGADDNGHGNNSTGLKGNTAKGQPVQRMCRECEEGDAVFMKMERTIQRLDIDSPPGNGSREAIVAAARSQIGKVEAKHDDGGGKRVGAKYLLEYFHKAAPGVWDDSIIETAGAAMPSWCGIFSVWAHKQAGLDIGNWQMGRGVSAFGKLSNTSNPQPGDIGYIHDPKQHHCIVVKVDGGNVHSIDGNSGLFSEVKENVRPLSAYTLFMTAFNGSAVQTKADDTIQQKNENGTQTASANVESRLTASKGTGDALPDDVRSGMENNIGADFSNVKIHTGSDAVQMSKDLHAQAFTHGSDIYFNSGKYDTESKSGQHLLAHELTHTVQQGAALQKKEVPAIQKASDTSVNAQPKFIVEENAAPTAQQLKRSAFLARLNQEVCKATDEGLAGTAFTSQACPYITAAFARLQTQTPQQIESTLMRYEPKLQKAETLEQVFTIIKERVRNAVDNWVSNGDLSGVPAAIALQIPASFRRVPGIIAALRIGLGSAISGTQKFLAGIGSILFKAKAGGARPEKSPVNIMQRLGEGNSMESGTLQKMEGAFGTSFSGVKVHTGQHAQQMASDMNARAFTVGNHIAFGSGEHRPGTLTGDALMAHELAHVQQQKGAGQTAAHGGDEARLETEADDMVMEAATNTAGEKIQAKRKTGLSLQRCGSDKPGYEELGRDRKGKVEEYMYKDLMGEEETEDVIPGPMEVKWSGDPFLLTIKREKKNDYEAGTLSIKVEFLGRHNPKGPGALMDHEETYEINLTQKATLNIFTEQIENTIHIWPYGKGPRDVHFEFNHEGPKYVDYNDVKGRLHHFTFRNRSGGGYQSGPFYVADKDAIAADYPEAAEPFYSDKEEGIGVEPVIRIGTDYQETRLDVDADYYRELVLRFNTMEVGDQIKYAWVAYYIPSDPKGTFPQLFSFSVNKDKVPVPSYSQLVNRTDGGSDTIIGLANFHDPKLLLSLPVATIKDNRINYTWKVSSGQSGQFNFPLAADYKPADSKVEVPEGGTKSTNRIWGQNAHFGPYKDMFRVTIGINDESSKEAFINIRSAGNGSIEGKGSVKLPLTGIDASNPFAPQLLQGNGQGLEIAIDTNKKLKVQVYDLITQEKNFFDNDDARKHKLRLKGTTLNQDYFFKFEVDNHEFKRGGGLVWDYPSGGQEIGPKDDFDVEAKTLSLDVLTENKSFKGRLAEYERELIIIRKKAHDEQMLDDAVFQAWANLNGTVLLYSVEATEEHKKSLLGYLDGYVSAYPKADSVANATMRAAIAAGNMEPMETAYFRLLKPMDAEIVEKFAASDKQVLKDLSMKYAYLLDVAGQMNEIRSKSPLRIPATFAVKELYESGKRDFGHSLELYAYKDEGRLHLKNLTNRKEVGHVETGIPAGSENKSVADLLVETSLVDQLNDPDLFPAGLLNYKLPGYTSAKVETEGGMSATSYAKLIGGAIAITGLVLLAIASLGTLAPETAAGIAAVGGWMMLIGDVTVFGAAAIDIIADRYNKGHFDSKRVLVNLFDIATSLLSAGSLTLGRVAVTGSKLARTGAQISNFQKFAGKWYTTVRLAQGVAGATGIILVADDAVKKIKAISNMEEGEGRTEAAISLFWHLLSIGAIAVIGLAGSNQFNPSKMDLLILSYAKARGTTLPVAYLGGIAKFTRANIGEFADEAAALKFIENNLTDEAKLWFNARYGAETPAAKLSRLEGIEAAWEGHKLDVNGALTVSASKAKMKAGGVLAIPADAALAQRYIRMQHVPFLNWTTTVVNFTAAGINTADQTFLFGMLEKSGFAYATALSTADGTALIAIRNGMRTAYLEGTTGALAGNITALNPHFTALGGSLNPGVIDRLKIVLSNHFIQDKVLYGRQQQLPAVAGAAPAGEAQRTVVGAHSSKILTDPRYEFYDSSDNLIVDPVNNIRPNSDGTFSVNFRKNIGFTNPDPTKPNFQGRKNNVKGSTLAPLSWTDMDILNAGENVARFGVVHMVGTQIFKYGNYKGVNWVVVLVDGSLTASYPVGPVPPAGVPKIPTVP